MLCVCSKLPPFPTLIRPAHLPRPPHPHQPGTWKASRQFQTGTHSSVQDRHQRPAGSHLSDQTEPWATNPDLPLSGQKIPTKGTTFPARLHPKGPQMQNPTLRRENSTAWTASSEGRRQKPLSLTQLNSSHPGKRDRFLIGRNPLLLLLLLLLSSSVVSEHD